MIHRKAGWYRVQASDWVGEVLRPIKLTHSGRHKVGAVPNALEMINRKYLADLAVLHFAWA